MKALIGIIMLIMLAVIIFIVSVKLGGLKDTLLAFGLTFIIVIWVVVAVVLIK